MERNTVMVHLNEKLQKISSVSGNEVQQKVLEMYPEVFTGLGKLSPEHHISLREDAEPVIHPPRKIPVTLRNKLKKESDEMEKNEVIEKVEEPTEWVKSLVLVEKPDGS